MYGAGGSVCSTACGASRLMRSGFVESSGHLEEGTTFFQVSVKADDFVVCLFTRHVDRPHPTFSHVDSPSATRLSVNARATRR